MRLSVKVLGGAECCVDAQDDYTVEKLKKDIEAKLKLGSKTEQKLLFKGKTLQDGTFLSAYQLTDGSKLNLILKREAKPPTTVSGPSPQNIRPSGAEQQQQQQQQQNILSIEEELAKHLKKHFKSEADAQKVLTSFMTVYNRRMSNLSLDDYERISKNFHETKKLRF